MRQFGLTKCGLFLHSTMRNAPYIHPRHDLILKLWQTFLNAVIPWLIFLSHPHTHGGFLYSQVNKTKAGISCNQYKSWLMSEDIIVSTCFLNRYTHLDRARLHWWTADRNTWWGGGYGHGCRGICVALDGAVKNKCSYTVNKLLVLQR